MKFHKKIIDLYLPNNTKRRFFFECGVNWIRQSKKKIQKGKKNSALENFTVLESTDCRYDFLLDETFLNTLDSKKEYAIIENIKFIKNEAELREKILEIKSELIGRK